MSKTIVTLKTLLESGRSIIPINADKTPAMNWAEFCYHIPTPKDYMSWLLQAPTTWAMVTGKVSGVMTLDFDGQEGTELIKKHKLQPHRKTPNGYHLDVAWEGNEARSGISVMPGVDLRGDNGYVVVLGQGYEWLRDIEPVPTNPLKHLMRRPIK